MSIGLAFNIFFKVLGDREFAGKLSDWMNTPALPAAKPEKPSAAKKRSEAVDLLAALQREGRLVDFLKEKLDDYSDAQIGAAVRDIHRDCASAVDRMFGIADLVDLPEGSEVSLPAEIDPGQFKLTGRVGSQVSKGKLCHHGWKITRHDIPAWTGRETSAWAIAPAEVEIT
jgi:Domain of unknown function (DUF2760)